MGDLPEPALTRRSMAMLCWLLVARALRSRREILARSMCLGAQSSKAAVMMRRLGQSGALEGSRPEMSRIASISFYRRMSALRGIVRRDDLLRFFR